MTSIGDTLRNERFRRGWTLQQVAADIKIHPRLLEAIEEDAFDRLPCAMLARSFVRQYARAMSVDEREAVEQVNQRLAEAGIPPSLPEFKDRSSRIPLLPPFADIQKCLKRESSLAAFVWLTLASFGCATVYTAWLSKSEGGAATAELHAATTGNVATAVPEPHLATPSNDLPAPAPHLATAGNVAPPPAESHLATASNVGTATRDSNLAPLNNLGTTAADQATSDPIRVLFTATEPVWISVRSDGAPIYTGTLQVQQSRQFEGDRKMMVTVGNAGGVIVTLNGKPLGPIGRTGEVRLLELAPGGVFLNKSPGN